jgi:hypothetical protein
VPDKHDDKYARLEKQMADFKYNNTAKLMRNTRADQVKDKEQFMAELTHYREYNKRKSVKNDFTEFSRA